MQSRFARTGPFTRSEKVAVGVSAVLVVAALAVSAFGPSKPEPERNCREKGVAVECPVSIQLTQRAIDCIDRTGSIRLTSGKTFSPDSDISGVKTEVTQSPNGMYEIKLTIPAGVTGYTKALSCTATEYARALNHTAP
ncbi:MAG: hypothetical protein Q7S22_04600 [Candidatus Micrarchaeota archaeon]|nr:hypothetical protein [Candidatus Micrarchaeota archaeon]